MGFGDENGRFEKKGRKNLEIVLAVVVYKDLKKSNFFSTLAFFISCADGLSQSSNEDEILMRNRIFRIVKQIFREEIGPRLKTKLSLTDSRDPC